MPTGRRSTRRLAVFVVYQQDLLSLDVEAAIGRVDRESIDEHTLSIVRGVDANRTEIDSVLRGNLSGWRLERLGALERAVLRVAAYELMCESSTPTAVVVDEAVNLTKRFCSVEAGALVNGILGGVVRSTRGAEGESHA